MTADRLLSPAGQQLLDRRRFLAQTATGLGGIALAHLLHSQGLLAADTPLSPKPIQHHPPRARNVVVLFCSGALSQVDTFDYKPDLIKYHDQPLPGGQKVFTFQSENGNLVKSPWKFKPRGQSGKMVSDLLPRLAELADEMCFLHSLTSKTNTHGPGETFLSTGFTLEGFPSMGAWVSYALGAEADDLPAFVAIPDPRGVPQASVQNWARRVLPPWASRSRAVVGATQPRRQVLGAEVIWPKLP